MTTFHDLMTPLVERAAVTTVNKWPSYVSVEDVQQELWLWAYEKQASVEKAQKIDGWEAKVYSTMLKVASATASKEDQNANGYTKDDTYIYSVAVIETLLESAFVYEDWQSFGFHGDGQPSAKGQVNETGDIYAMLSDIKAGLADIKEEYREVLFYKYGLHLESDAVAEKLGITSSTVRNRSARAVKALRDKLGRVNPADLRAGWDNRREAIGMERAQIQTERQYEG
jgi:DNA-directed RNA polymerase specialized sigma24 family protein